MDLEIATITITHCVNEDNDTELRVEAGELGLMEALGMLELAKVVLIERDADEADEDVW